MTHDGAVRLWGEVIKRAVDDARGNTMPTEAPTRDRIDAAQWLRAAEDTPGGFGFACDAVEIDPARLRRMVNRLAGGET